MVEYSNSVRLIVVCYKGRHIMVAYPLGFQKYVSIQDIIADIEVEFTNTIIKSSFVIAKVQPFPGW